MILLTVLSYNGTPAQGLAASFDEIGGTIGRADHNQLVLEDPGRTISRVHARVVFRSTGYAIVDNGSNPISVNDTPVGSGREQPLGAGDRVQIGGYQLLVSEVAAARSDDPFADLFGDSNVGLAAPPKMAQPADAAAAAGRPSAPAAASGATGGLASEPAGLSRGYIPDDWDPFATVPDAGTIDPASPLTAPMSGSGHAPAHVSQDLSFGSSSGDSLDDLFGLAGTPVGVDPLGGSPQQALAIQPNLASHANPLEALERAACAPAQSEPDHVSELKLPMQLNPLREPEQLGTLVSADPAPARGAVFSWDVPTGGMTEADAAAGGTRIAAKSSMRRPESVQAVPAVPATESVSMNAPDAARATTAAAPWVAEPAAAVPPPCDEAALRAALLDGLDVPGLRIDALTPELMALIGALLRESTQGAVELLAARSALKREMRAEMTMIVARENNPLKFSPSADVALQHLLSPPARGFMPAAPAMRDAFNDLRAHQLAVMAGMKAAVEGALQRFDPQQLEARLTRRSTIETLIPAARKAKLWEAFQALFGQLSSEAQDGFDDLFGKAFLRAYEAQLDHGQAEPQAD